MEETSSPRPERHRWDQPARSGTIAMCTKCGLFRHTLKGSTEYAEPYMPCRRRPAPACVPLLTPPAPRPR